MTPHISTLAIRVLSSLPIQFALSSLLRASCLSFSSDPKKFKIFLSSTKSVYGWISMAIASSHQTPHHHQWCLPLWHSPRLTLSLTSGFLCFLLLSSPAVAQASTSTHTYRRWWCLSSASQPLVAAGPALLFFIFFLFYFFFNFYLPFRQDRNPFDTHFVSFSY